MKTVLLVLALFISYAGYSQPKEFYNKQFKWKITIPEGFDSVPVAEWNKMKNRGVSAIEETYDAKVEDMSKTLFVVRSDQFNYFESSYQPFDTATDGSYEENCRAVNDVVYGTFEAQMPGVKLDSASSIETIGGLQFRKFSVTIAFRENLVMEAQMYSRLFGKYEFALNIMTMDAEKQESLLKAWKASTFGK